MDGILARDALDQALALEGGEIGAEELMRATLQQIERLNGPANAIVSLRDAEALLAEARAADAAPRKGWLHGLPVAIKDLADAEGLPTSKGSPVLAGQVAQRDSLHVSRMKAAGAIVIGKTNTPEFGLGSNTFNPVHGTTGNAYDAGRTCGGSSGGAAVALALRMLPVADGSDMMGSLRNPAGWNNVYGMRPSWGRVPDWPEGETYLHKLSTNGPMARSPRDLAALLDVQAGPVAGAPFCLPKVASLPDIDAPVAGRRIAWARDWGGAFPFEPGILDLCETALAGFADLGVTVEAIDPPFDRDALWQSWLDLRAFANAARLGQLYDDPGHRPRLKATALWEIEQGRNLTLAAVEAASLTRSQWYARADALFQTHDVIALPTAQVWPFPLDQEYPTEVAGHAMDTYHRWMEVMIPASLIGLPAISVPAGFGANGLPMGLQLIGAHGADAAVLQLAQAWHRATDWPNRRPPPGV
ncbi:amidase [Pararhodobacter sp. SW119]|uniref:amidase n=1 Tax=Pararhodobacter sp. SW119 TaxID=2780075 RepID=UPI001ADF45DB|nr:amidase [Pararhodobacter sp. SW119]